MGEKRWAYLLLSECDGMSIERAQRELQRTREELQQFKLNPNNPYMVTAHQDLLDRLIDGHKNLQAAMFDSLKQPDKKSEPTAETVFRDLKEAWLEISEEEKHEGLDKVFSMHLDEILARGENRLEDGTSAGWWDCGYVAVRRVVEAYERYEHAKRQDLCLQMEEAAAKVLESHIEELKNNTDAEIEEHEQGMMKFIDGKKREFSEDVFYRPDLDETLP